jgi:xanthine dehydrogenase YagS FAD-binding subunit
LKSFLHVNAGNLAEAQSLLSQYAGKAMVLAGGTDVLSIYKDDYLPTLPQVLVNIKSISGLDYIKVEQSVLKIGALTPIFEVQRSSVVATGYPAIIQATSDKPPALASMATVAGNLCQGVRCWYYRNKLFNCIAKGGATCYASQGQNEYYHSIFGSLGGCYATNPSDLAPVLIAMGGGVVTTARTLSLEDLYKITTPTQATTLANDEIITEIDVPTPAAGTTSSFLKLAIRNAIDFALASVAVSLTISGGTCSAAKICMNGVSRTPQRSSGAENALKGNAVNSTTAANAAAAAVQGATAMTGNSWKVAATKTLVSKAILACIS